MAEKLGISRETINAWESGKQDMRPAYVMAICYLTGFSVDDILLPSDTTEGGEPCQEPS